MSDYSGKYECFGQYQEDHPDCEACDDKILCRDHKFKEGDADKVLCDSCEWFIRKGKKLKCKFFKEKERLKLLKMESFECPEYQLDHRLRSE